MQFEKKLDAFLRIRGWELRDHQKATLLSQADASLLIAPTGAGKTLAGFLPTLKDLTDEPRSGLHTVYVSPLKALAADMKRNLQSPVDEMDLPIRIEDRTGDTSSHIKKRQRADPPHILLTTPESLALMMSYPEAPKVFAGVKRIIIDEIHALSESKRGDQLMLAVARLETLAPGVGRTGLSATIADPSQMASYLAGTERECEIILADAGAEPDVSMISTEGEPPWSGGGAIYAIPEVMDLIAQHKTTLIFHNTRAQAEIFFHNLWLANDDNLPIGIHHGSISKEQRQQVERAMVAGELRAIVCTGSLDLGIDWGDVDLVIQVGAPKNVKRLVQRIGRANHKYETPSKAVLVPANRFEVIECIAAINAARSMDLDDEPPSTGPLDVLIQHLLLTAAAGAFCAEKAYDEARSAWQYRNLERATFDRCLDFAATGGYALRRYDRWHRLRQNADGLWELRDPRTALQLRLNAGTIEDNDTLAVRFQNRQGGKALGEVEEGFAASLTPGDTFVIGGQVVRFETMKELTVEVSKAAVRKPKFAVFSGTKFSTSQQLTDRILDLINASDYRDIPEHTAFWLRLQKEISALPQHDRLLVETFEHDARQNMCVYGFAGRNAMQTLGLMLTHRMEKEGLAPTGFVATDYATLIWGLEQIPAPEDLLDRKLLEQDFEQWLSGNAVMKRTFRNVATISGLIERNNKMKRKSGRQATFSSDILYDTLRKYDPDHLLLDVTRKEAMSGLVDFHRIEELLEKCQGNIQHIHAQRITPFSAPLFLEIGRVPIDGEAKEQLLRTRANELLTAAGLSTPLA